MGNKKRQVKPETRSIPLTFCDCPDCVMTDLRIVMLAECGYEIKYPETPAFLCETVRSEGKCPRGFA